eukprot:3842173-Amphidinium_carterae.1
MTSKKVWRSLTHLFGQLQVGDPELDGSCVTFGSFRWVGKPKVLSFLLGPGPTHWTLVQRKRLFDVGPYPG